MADQPEMKFVDITQTAEVLFEDERSFLVEMLDRAVAGCVKRAQRYQGKSEMTVKLQFVPDADRMLIKASLATKYPEPESLPVPAYVTREGKLVADDPKQILLPFENANLREVK